MYYLNDKGLYLSWVFVLLIGILVGVFAFNMYLKNIDSNVGTEARQYEYYRGMYEFCIGIGANFGLQEGETVNVCRESVLGAISVDRFSIEEIGWEKGFWTGLSKD